MVCNNNGTSNWRILSIIFASLLRTLPLSDCLVAIPERQVVRQLVLSSKEELYLQTAPLIGGPRWLPLHVKVVLETNNEWHRWELVPLNATDPTIVRSLLSLQQVPARLRYQNGTASPSPDPPPSVVPDWGIVLDGRTTGGDVANPKLLQAAAMFCATYPTELHLIRNNCWSFAWGLYDFLLEEQKRQRQLRGEEESA